MSYAILCLLVLLGAFFFSSSYITVFYHRAFAHGSVTLGARTRRFAVLAGPWITGIDPKAWACMHRLHHRYPDQSRDPHSPANVGVAGVFLAQLRAYERILAGLIGGKRSYSAVVKDLDFPISWANRRQLWYLPYVVQIGVALALGFAFDVWLLAACFYAGLLAHPVQGWLVNSFGHASGYRTFDTPDDSRNNLPIALLVSGEGLQNNHHHDPDSARFSYRNWEPDPGYAVCRGLSRLGILSINKHAVDAPRVALLSAAGGRG
ncbi:MAG: acyl-CoA desaturase [Deltaproteobacteria bacterium]|nr:acyl-CoA desaturase [Deltaproteobacteria bacterium]